VMKQRVKHCRSSRDERDSAQGRISRGTWEARYVLYAAIYHLGSQLYRGSGRNPE
jgi:hypothetical protein